MPKPRYPRTTIRVVGAAIADGPRVLIAQRGPLMSSPGKWEFPGGKVQAGETPTQALRREIFEELSLKIKVGTFLGNGTVTTGRQYTLSLDVYAATIQGGALHLAEHSASKWVGSADFANYDWSEADRPILDRVGEFLDHRKDHQ